MKERIGLAVALLLLSSGLVFIPQNVGSAIPGANKIMLFSQDKERKSRGNYSSEWYDLAEHYTQKVWMFMTPWKDDVIFQPVCNILRLGRGKGSALLWHHFSFTQNPAIDLQYRRV